MCHVMSSYSLLHLSTPTPCAVCPDIKVNAPSVAPSGSSLNVETLISTKPRPQNNSVVVTANFVSITNQIFKKIDILTDGASYRVPQTVNNYSFFHSFPVPVDTLTGDTVQILVNVNEVDHGSSCEYSSSISKVTSLVKGE